MNSVRFSIAAVAMIVSGTAAPAAITFDTQVSTVTTYEENGFTLTTLSGAGSTATGFGNPSPSLYFGSNLGSPSFSFSIVASSGSFTFSGFDIAANNGSVDYTITGFLDGNAIYSLSATQATIFPFGFVTVASNTPLTFDELVFSATANGTTGNFDNIQVSSAAAVPEPASWALMVSGFGMLGAALRRKSARIRIRFA